MKKLLVFVSFLVLMITFTDTSPILSEKDAKQILRTRREDRPRKAGFPDEPMRSSMGKYTPKHSSETRRYKPIDDKMTRPSSTPSTLDLFMGTEKDIYYDCVKGDKVFPAVAMCSL